MKKVCAVAFIALLVSVQAFAYDLPERMLDPGSFDLTWSSNKDGSQVLGSFSLAEYYLVKPETGYFTCFSPLHLDMAYTPQTGKQQLSAKLAVFKTGPGEPDLWIDASVG